MSHFSIREALRFSFVSYVHNFALFVFIGLFLTGSSLLLKNGSEYLTSYYGIDASLRINFSDEAKNSNSLSGSFEQKRTFLTVKEAFRKVVAAVQNKKKSDLVYFSITNLIMLFLQLFFSLGAIKIALTLKDGKRAYALQFFEGYKIIGQAIGAILLVATYAVGLMVAILIFVLAVAFVVYVLTKSGNFTALLALTVFTCCSFAGAYKVAEYFLFDYSLLDIPNQTVRGSLRASQSLVQDCQLNFVAALILSNTIFSIIAYCVAIFVTCVALWMQLGSFGIKNVQDFAMYFQEPLKILFLASVYRDLTQPRPVTSK